MRRLGARLAWGLERAAWKLDANVVWPGVDAIQDPPNAYAEEAPASARRPWWYRHGADLLLAAALTVVAFLLRRHGLPTDGLWLDDSITGAGRTAAASDLFAVSADHPGFMVALMGLSDLSGGNDVSLTYPALVAGTLGPPLLFLALRWCG